MAIEVVLETYNEMNVSKEEAKNNIMKKFDLTPEKAAEYIDQSKIIRGFHGGFYRSVKRSEVIYQNR